MNSEQIFEVQKNRKAFTYTLIICGVILLLFIIISPMAKGIPIKYFILGLGFSGDSNTRNIKLNTMKIGTRDDASSNTIKLIVLVLAC